MKELYSKPELLVEKFASVDVMTASGDQQPGGDIIVDDD